MVNNESSIKSIILAERGGERSESIVLTQERAFTKGTLVSPSAVASPKRLCSGLERLYLAGHEDDKLVFI